MPRTLLMLAGAVLIVCGGMLAMNARESEVSARAVTKACSDAARARANWNQVFTSADPRLGGYLKQPSDSSQCTYERRWDLGVIKGAGFALTGGFSLLAFGIFQRRVPA